MGAYRIAQRYAKSLLQLAQERKALETVYSEMVGICALTSASRELKLLLKSPIITADRKINVLSKIFDGKVSELTYRFLELLVKKGREPYIPEISAAFIEQYKALNKITTVKITSAVKLEPSIVQKIIIKLKAEAGLINVDVQEEVDESLIGGVIVKYGDKQADASVKRYLQQVEHSIIDESFIRRY